MHIEALTLIHIGCAHEGFHDDVLLFTPTALYVTR